MPLSNFVKMTLAAACGAAAASTVAFVVLPQREAAAPPPQVAAVQGIVRDYLLANPEVIRDAMIELDRREKADAEAQRQKAVADLRPKIFDSSNQAVIGNPNGKITLVEFFDYNCSYCKHSLDDIASLMKNNPDLRVVLKDFPVLGPQSVEAAQVATAVRKQLSGDKFWDFHRKLLGARGQATKASAMAVAAESGVDMDRLARDVGLPEVHAAIEEVMKMGDSLSLTGTPSFVVGDDVVVGAVGYDELKSKVDNVRKCGKANCG